MGFHQPFFFCYLLLVIKSDLFSKNVNASESNSDEKGKKSSHRVSHAMCVCEKSGRIDTRAGGNYGRDIPLSRDRLSNSLHPALWCSSSSAADTARRARSALRQARCCLVGANE